MGRPQRTTTGVSSRALPVPGPSPPLRAGGQVAVRFSALSFFDPESQSHPPRNSNQKKSKVTLLPPIAKQWSVCTQVGDRAVFFLLKAHVFDSFQHPRVFRIQVLTISTKFHPRRCKILDPNTGQHFVTTKVYPNCRTNTHHHMFLISFLFCHRCKS